MGINILIRVNHTLGDFVQSEVGKFTSEFWVTSYPVLFNLIGLAKCLVGKIMVWEF